MQLLAFLHNFEHFWHIFCVLFFRLEVLSVLFCKLFPSVGVTSWCRGREGDQLKAKLGVCVFFAVSLTLYFTWIYSKNGTTTKNVTTLIYLFNLFCSSSISLSAHSSKCFLPIFSSLSCHVMSCHVMSCHVMSCLTWLFFRSSTVHTVLYESAGTGAVSLVLSSLFGWPMVAIVPVMVASSMLVHTSNQSINI